jgi:uncharacterized protein (TIGR03067 family)
MRARLLLAMGVSFLMAAPVVAEDKEKDKGKDKFDATKLVGTWNYVSGENNGTKVDPDSLKKGTVTITKDTITLQSELGKFVIKYTVDAKKSPVQLSMEITEGVEGSKGAKAIGIIELKGDQLKLCYPAMGGKAPKEFAAKKDSGLHYFVLKKKK